MTTQPMPPIPIPIADRRRSLDVGWRLETEGPEACADEELLAVAVGDGLHARRLARRLVDRFGSLRDVLRASPA
ncbi:MAG: hypothetical protein ACXWWL_01180, partial [Candidatus Limnocylindria bacterium]